MISGVMKSLPMKRKAWVTEAADFSRHLHEAWGGLAEDNFLVADLEKALVGLGEEFCAGGDLIAESEEIGGIGPVGWRREPSRG